jgi:hypothetical protein
VNIRDLDNKVVAWRAKGSTNPENQAKSSLHLEGRRLLKERFPTILVLEEVSIPVRHGNILFLDFYLPTKKVAVETHGEQHYRYIDFFHHNFQSYLHQKQRDVNKVDWCEKNGIKIIILPYDKVKEWKEMI